MTSSLSAVVAATLLTLAARTARAGDPDLPSPVDAAASTPSSVDATPVPVDATPATVDTDDVRSTSLEASGRTMTADVISSGRGRGVAEDFLVLPSGVDVGGRLRTIMADDALGTGALKITDLTLLDLQAQWAFARHYELDGSITLLPTQPSTTDEPVFQGGSLAVRRDLVPRTAVAVSGSAAPLLGRKGLALGGAAAVAHKYRLNEVVAFGLAGGATTTWIRDRGAMAGATASSGADTALLVEGVGHADVQFAFNRFWGFWMGAGYALPAYHRGNDPVSGLRLDPQPRLDLDIGTAVRIADRWDLLIDLSIVDRGDLAAPATRIPVIDGGFDQIQLTVGVSHRLVPQQAADRNVGASLRAW